MRQIFIAVFVIVIIVSLITVAFTFNQVTQEEFRLKSDIQYRSSIIADSLKESIEPNFINKSNDYLQNVVEKFADNQRIAGLAIVDNTGKIVAVSSALPKEVSEAKLIAADVMDADKSNGDFVDFNKQKMYVFASPLHDKESVVGSLMIVHNANYIDTRLTEIWKNNLVRFLTLSVLISVAFLLILRWIIISPLRKLVESIKINSSENSNRDVHKVFNNPIFGPLIQELGTMQKHLIEAKIAAGEEARLRLKKLESPWTKERLAAFVAGILKERKFFVVSNREPYVHTKVGKKITYYSPATGVVTALEPVMQACGGMWIAFGNGNADKLVVDSEDKVGVPPDNPQYTLKRIWLSEDEEKGYNAGFSSEGIWPLCHFAHTRPVFRKADWEQYQKVNKKFAKTLLTEIKNIKDPIIFIQDFQFSLLPRMIKDVRPDATISMFWHIPWPNAESFSICPWKKEMLDGMLGADLVGFHTQLHANNFIDTVGRELEALIDLETFSIIKNSHITLVKPFPISIAFTNTTTSALELNKYEVNRRETLKKLGIKSKHVGVGIERFDYVKGLLEKLQALEAFFIKHPSYIENFTFIQVAVPSTTTNKTYQDYRKRVEEEVERINNRFKTKQWKPIILFQRHHTHEEINMLFRAVDFCLVTSLHDGMNLVAKEFVAARNDEKGVLILSQFVGASRELRDSLIINPYNSHQAADAIYSALTMKKSEQMKRMKRLREVVKNANVYRWAADVFKTMVDLEPNS